MGSVAASAAKRVALVIGNAVYKHADTLKNPANDAKAIGAALTRLGFTGAKPKLNLNYHDFLQALKQFRADAEGADMAAIYFAGHGIEVDDSNFLIPVDAKLQREGDVEFETVPLNQPLRTIERANRLGVIILDACRDNPFRQKLERSHGKRSFGRGLREVKVSGDNMLVAYAAEQGTFALDGAGGNSPFAEALLAHMERPGLEIAMLFRQVRDDVLNRTKRVQKPYVYASLGGANVFLKPPPLAEVPTLGDDERPVNGPPFTAHPSAWLTAVIAGLSATVGALALALWLQTGSPQPAIPAADNQAEKARQDADRIANDAAFAKARQAGTKAALTGYLKDHPQGRNVAAARAELTRLGFVEVAIGPGKAVRWFKAGGGAQDGETFKDCADCPQMVALPPGEFLMGSPDNEAGRDSDEGPQHAVTIAQPFAVGRFEVTFAEWDACVAAGACKHKPETDWGRGNQPVMRVSWNDVSTEYLPWLSKNTGKTYRLLTEAEWEYSARARTQTRFSFGDSEAELANYAWFISNSGSKTHPVGERKANDWGLHDMHGNVWEWVQDCKIDYKDTPRDGSAAKAADGCARVLRGGSWLIGPQFLRSAYRTYGTPDFRSYYFGVRVARTLSPL